MVQAHMSQPYFFQLEHRGLFLIFTFEMGWEFNSLLFAGKNTGSAADMLKI